MLPVDILYEVLLWLPADELCRLRLVCRSWRSLTSDPTFAKAHSSRHPLVVAKRCTDPNNEVHLVDMLSGRVVKRIYTGQAWYGDELSTHLGWLCISQVWGPDNKAYVVNPATGAVTVLPDAADEPEKCKSTSFESTYVLGRVPSTGEYKVLRIHVYIDVDEDDDWVHHQTNYVITLVGNGAGGSGAGDAISWRVRPCPPVLVCVTPGSRAVVQGVAYNLSGTGGNSDGAIASFDLATEEWRIGMLQRPSVGHIIAAKDEDSISFQLANLNGCLVTICYHTYYNVVDCSMDFWFLMDVDTGIWTKRYSLLQGLGCPLGILDNERILLWDALTQALRAYDQRTSTSTDMSTIKSFFDVAIYQGSLLCSDVVN